MQAAYRSGMREGIDAPLCGGISRRTDPVQACRSFQTGDFLGSFEFHSLIAPLISYALRRPCESVRLIGKVFRGREVIGICLI